MGQKQKAISLERARVLKSRIDDYLNVRNTIPKGLEMDEMLHNQKQKILKVLRGDEADWLDYKWQLKNRIKDSETLSQIINLTPEEKKAVDNVGEQFRWSISPYYLSLINPDETFDPIKLMAMPSFMELEDTYTNLDPMNEEYTNPAGTITRRYPDRLIINVTNECAMYCRHCQRRRNIGSEDLATPQPKIQESIDYIKENTEIRDVLVTGGDPLTLSDTQLEWILKQLHEIEHVEYIRIGSRTPVTMPQRITDDLVKMLKKYHPIYLNSHFNHPMEVTKEAKMACEKLANNGIPLGNQAVLLNGINNDKFIMRTLNHELLKIRVKPYYLFHAKTVKGTRHFNTSIDDGLEIMEYLRGYTSGMSIPTYIVNAPGGKGKTPILPEYLISRGKDYFTIRTWEGEILHVENHPSIDLKAAIKQQTK